MVRHKIHAEKSLVDVDWDLPELRIWFFGQEPTKRSTYNYDALYGMYVLKRSASCNLDSCFRRPVLPKEKKLKPGKKVFRSILFGWFFSYLCFAGA